jgi:two-component system KDP operon response regulator KdpE
MLRHKSLGTASEEREDPIFKVKDLVIDTGKHRVWIAGQEIRLTPQEYKVLVLLAKNRGKVLTHNYITEKIWGGMISDDVRSLRVCMGNLRRKLKEDPSVPKYIVTEIGVGYRFVDE